MSLNREHAKVASDDVLVSGIRESILNLNCYMSQLVLRGYLVNPDIITAYEAGLKNKIPILTVSIYKELIDTSELFKDFDKEF